MNKFERILMMPFFIIAYIFAAMITNLKLGWQAGKENHEDNY